MSAAHRLERRRQLFHSNTGLLQQRRTLCALRAGQRQQQMFGGDVFVAHALRLCLGGVEYGSQLTGKRRIGIGLLGIAGDFGVERRPQCHEIDVAVLQDRHDDAFVLIQQDAQQMRIVNQRIAIAAREGQRVGQGFGGFDGQAISVHETKTVCVCGGNTNARTIARALVLSDSLYRESFFNQSHAVDLKHVHIHARSDFLRRVEVIPVPVRGVLATGQQHILQRLTPCHVSCATLNDRHFDELRKDIQNSQVHLVLPTAHRTRREIPHGERNPSFWIEWIRVVLTQ